MAIAKLVDKGERSKALLERRGRAAKGLSEALKQEEALTNQLTRLVTENYDLYIARLR